MLVGPRQAGSNASELCRGLPPRKGRFSVASVSLQKRCAHGCDGLGRISADFRFSPSTILQPIHGGHWQTCLEKNVDLGAAHGLRSDEPESCPCEIGTEAKLFRLIPQGDSKIGSIQIAGGVRCANQSVGGDDPIFLVHFGAPLTSGVLCSRSPRSHARWRSHQNIRAERSRM